MVQFLEDGNAKVTPLAALRICRLTYLVKQMKKLVAFNKLKSFDQDLNEWTSHDEITMPIGDFVHAPWLKVLEKFPTSDAVHPGGSAPCCMKTLIVSFLLAEFKAAISKSAENAGSHITDTVFRPYMDTRDKVIECHTELTQVYPAFELLCHLDLDLDVIYN